jgi:hypothetical protein
MKVVTSFYICTKDQEGNTIKVLEFADLDLAKQWASDYQWTKEETYTLIEAPSSKGASKSLQKYRGWWKSSWEAEKKPLSAKKAENLTRKVSAELSELWKTKKKLAGKYRKE